MLLGNDLLAAFEVDPDPLATLLHHRLYAAHLLAQPHGGPVAPEMVYECVNDLGVHEGQELRQLVHQGDTHPECCEDAGVLEADNTRADDRQRPR